MRLEAKVHIVTGAVLVGAEHHQVRQPHRAQRGRHRAAAAGLRARRCWPRTRRSWASPWSTSAAAPPTSPSSPDGAIVHTAVIALGGNNLTNDIAIGLRTPAHEAERIKQRYGCAWPRWWTRTRPSRCPSVGGRQPRVLGAADPLRDPRAARGGDLPARPARDRRSAATRTCSPAAWSSPAARRCSPGMAELAEEVLGLPVRRGMPQGHRRPGRRGQDPHVRHRGRAGAVRCPAPGPALLQDPRGERLPQGPEPDAAAGSEEIF